MLRVVHDVEIAHFVIVSRSHEGYSIAASGIENTTSTLKIQTKGSSDFKLQRNFHGLVQNTNKYYNTFEWERL